MEGLVLALIGAALFSHSWFLLGLYAEARTVGFIMALIGIALLFTLSFDPQILGAHGNPIEVLGDLTVMKMLVLFWAIYAGVVGAHGVWEYEDRAIGLYCVPLTAVNAISVFYFASVMFGRFSGSAAIAYTFAAVLLTIISAVLFVNLAIPLRGIRQVTGWFMLVGSIVVMTIGLVLVTTIIVA